MEVLKKVANNKNWTANRTRSLQPPLKIRTAEKQRRDRHEEEERE